MSTNLQYGDPQLESKLETTILFREIRPGRRIPRAGLAGSVAFHALLILLAFVGPRFARYSEPPSLYATMIAPEEKKIIWYRPSPKLPDVSPSRTATDGSVKRTQLLSPETLISEQKAPPGKQIIYTPQPKIELPRDIDAPNIVLPKLDLPPPKLEAPAVNQPPAPSPKVPDGPPKRPVKTFQAPVEHPKLPVQPQTNAIEAAPDLVASAPANPDVRFAVPRLPGPPPRKFIAPTPSPIPNAEGNSRVAITDAPPQVDLQSTSTAAAAVLGLRPSDINVVIPAGVRRAAISAGPKADDSVTGSGSTKTGPAAGSPVGMLVPEVTASSISNPGMARPGSLSKTDIPMPAVLPSPEQKRRWDAARTTFLAPQRPSSRVIPQRIESLFTGRTAYVVAIPVIDDLNFSGDWVFWFAERKRENGATNAIVRPPIPLGSKNRVPRAPAGPSSKDATVQLLATIGTDGSVAGVQIFKGWDDDTNRLAIATLEALTFLPALKNNVAIETESIIELPCKAVP